MLAERTLKILLVMSRRDRALAEQRAAEAARNLFALDGNETALNLYVSELADGRLSEVRTGYDLLSHGEFIHAGLKALETNRHARKQGLQRKDSAAQEIARETERHKAIRSTLDGYRSDDQKQE